MTGHTSQSDSRLTRRQRTVLSLVAVVCIVLSGVAVVTAQSGDTTFADGFESYTAGQFPDSNYTYVTGSGTDAVVTDSQGYASDKSITFSGDPTRVNRSWSDPTNGNVSVYIRNDGSRALLTLIDEQAEIGLYEQDEMVVIEDGAVTALDDSVTSDWVQVKFYNISTDSFSVEWSDGGNVSTSGPYDASGVGGYTEVSLFGRPGATFDNLVVGDGEIEPDDEYLDLDVPKYMGHNETAHYSVEYNDSGTWTDVTDEATITPENPGAVTFYPSNGTVHSTANATTNVQFDVTAEYQGLQDSEEMTVASADVENLDILPTWWKVNATVGDGMMLWLIVATLAAVVATRAATSFAGVGAYVMFMIAGWMTGSVSDGVVIAAILTGLFLGLNLAANVDTTIRGSG